MFNFNFNYNIINIMDYKIYKLFNNEQIDNILNSIDKNRYHDGKVGNIVNYDKKIRKDLFINENDLLMLIDKEFYNLYDDIKKNFSDIKYREKWKIGKYNGENKGFYNEHRDTTGVTCYRNHSCIIMLSDPDDYDGGELHFPELNQVFKLNKGELIIFRSDILHGVKPVVRGNRVVLISFLFDDKGMDQKLLLNNKNYISNYKPLLSSSKISYKLDNILNIDPWKDNDDYYFENNNSDILIVTFSGQGNKNEIPKFIFYNFLKNYSNIDKLYLRDITQHYYMTGLKNGKRKVERDDFKNTIDLIRKLTTIKNYKKIIALGVGSGGYASILYGNILNFHKIIAFSPQTVINHKKKELIGDIYNAPRTCEWLSSKNEDNDDYQKALDLKNYIPFNTNIDIHYCENGNKGIDKKHAIYIDDDDKCNLYEHPGNTHRCVTQLRDNGKLKEIIDKELK